MTIQGDRRTRARALSGSYIETETYHFLAHRLSVVNFPTNFVIRRISNGRKSKKQGLASSIRMKGGAIPERDSLHQKY